MEKLISINLAGNAYQVEEEGYKKLASYLADARAKLAGNPDIEEIVRDFEHALAQKCRAYLKPHKSVITTEEVETMLREMGPVENADEEPKAKEKHIPKRLYRIKEGALIGGICNGIGAYFNIDVTLVRIAFVLLAFLTSGAWIAGYVIALFIIPEAETPEDYVRATGTPPITAASLIEKARDGYEQFQNSEQWKDWKKRMHEKSKEWNTSYKYEYDAYNGYETKYYSPFWSFMHSLLGMLWTILIIGGLWFLYHNSIVAQEYMDMIGNFLFNATERFVERFHN
jgi:phage shock protein PspC (stress-responsive transcriptional regulator)